MQSLLYNMDYRYLTLGRGQINNGGPSPFGKLPIIKHSFGDAFGERIDKSKVKAYLYPENIRYFYY